MKPTQILDRAIKSTDPNSLQPMLFGELFVKPEDHPSGRSHLSAASGLVRAGKRWYVIADDELHLGIFKERSSIVGKSQGLKKGRLFRLLDGALPSNKKRRKAIKPDFESLMLLPAFGPLSAGVLFAVGSGSKPNRQLGLLIELDQDGKPGGRKAHVDLTALYVPLRKQFADLNIEGAFLSDDSTEFVLLHRGNQGDPRSACIRYAWPSIKQWLIEQGQERAQAEEKDQNPIQAPLATAVQVIPLGSVDGVPLSFTDGAALPNAAWVFCAVAEATMDSVQDGACKGSAVGVINQFGEVIYSRALLGNPKVEGISIESKNDQWEVTLVTDPDDAEHASQMLKITLPEVSVPRR